MSPSLRTSITVVVLYVVYWMYVAVVSPLTAPRGRESAAAAVAVREAELPSDAVVVAKQYLPGAAWAADAKIAMNREKEGFVYFNTFRPIKDDRQNKMRLVPFALVWFDPRRGDGEPYTVTCDSAVVEFEEKFDPGFGNSDNNRIVGGQFTGEVRITGPDGLLLVGGTIDLSEGQGGHGSLASDSNQPVSFAYGPAKGRSEQVRGTAQQFEITLATGDDSVLGKDMPHIGGVERIVLRRNVSIDLVMEEGGRPMPVHVQSDGPFEYDVGKLVAVFDDNVNVARLTNRPGESEEFDRLNCDRLVLAFEPRVDPEAELAQPGRADEPVIQPVAGATASYRRHQRNGLDLDVQLRSLRAIGRDVVLSSDENQLRGRMGDLRYDVAARKLMMLDNESVVVQIGSAHLSCPDIRMTHDEESRLQSAACEGAGQAWTTNLESGEIEVESSWSERLKLAKDPASEWDLLELHGDARVVHRQQEMGVVGDVLRVWFDGEQMQASARRFQQSAEGDADRDAETGGLPLRKVIAEQTGGSPVLMATPTLRLETERVEADFVEAARLPSGEERREDRTPFGGPSREDPGRPPVFVKAGGVRATVTIDPATNQPGLSELTASRDVRISRAGIEDGDPGSAPVTDDAADGPFSIECETLGLQNRATGQVLRLQGAPARIRFAQGEIEGNDILFDRERNNALVDGPGTIVVLVDRGLEGKVLETPERFRVSWREKMNFDGQMASFFGKTKTTLADSMMKCHRMDVTLNRRISFSKDAPDSQGLEIANIHCLDGVTVEYHEFGEPSPGEHSVLIGIRFLEVAEFSFDRPTGNFSARGPGKIDDWQRGDGQQRVMLGPPNMARANQAAKTSKLDWNYTWLKFAGELTGNQHDRFLVLKDRVQVIHGPVEHALQKIERDDLDEDTETARNSVWLQSGQMNLQLRAARSPQEEDWLEVVAFGDAQLEGKVFRARADSISFDQSKEQFTLKGKGTEAGIWFQKVPGQAVQPVFGKTIQFVPSKHRFWIDEATGFRITP